MISRLSVSACAIIAPDSARQGVCQPPLRALAHGPALDALLVVRPLKNGVYKNARRMDRFRVEPTELDHLFDFRDDIIGGGGHHGIEVSRGLAIDEVAPAIALP